MKHRAAALIGLAALAAAGLAYAQSTFPTQQPGISAPGEVVMCRNSSGTAVSCSELTPLPVALVGGISFPQYPTGAKIIAGIGTGSTGAVVGTLAAAPGRTTWICGFDVSAIGGTAAVGPIVVAGLAGGSFTYQMSSTAAGITLSRTFTPCIPGATLNTAITVTTTADGTATAVDVNSWGFQL